MDILNGNVIDGKLLAAQIRASAKEKVSHLKTKPCLTCILVGDNPASQSYVRSKVKACAECGIESQVITFPADISSDKIVQVIKQLNIDDSVSAILVQLPLPGDLHKQEDFIINSLSPDKDVDCLTNINLGKLFAGTGDIAPCTPSGIMKIFDELHYDLEGKDVVVVGRSLLVGRSVATLLQHKNATVTVCHSRTKNLAEKTSRADVVVAAVGRPKMFDGQYFKPGAIVIDVGINRTPDGLVGDVDFDAVKDKALYITPVPGGVGPLTVACLMDNTVKLHEKKEAALISATT